VEQPTTRKPPWPALAAALAVIVIAVALLLLSRAHSRASRLAGPPARPTPMALAPKPTAPAVRPPTPIARLVPTAIEVPQPAAVPTATPEPAPAPPPATPVPALPPTTGGEPQPLVVRAFREDPDGLLLAVTFSAPLAEKTKLKVEVGSAEQKLVKRQSVAPHDRVDLGDAIFAFEPEPARKARFEPGQPVSVLLWVGDAPPREFAVVVERGSYETIRGVRLVDERPTPAL